MRWRLVLGASIALNVVLWILLWQALQFPAQDTPGFVWRRSMPTVITNRTGGVVVRRQFFHWSEIESDDYPTYIENLRRIGCPELTIRDIIVADVNQMFAQRRAQEVVTGESQWWKSEPDMDATEGAMRKIGELEQERQQLLAKLLGPNWNINFTQVSQRGTVALDGPVLGKLDPSVKLQIEELAAASSRKANDYAEAQRAAGKPIDPVELARIRADQRTELVKILNPEQMEEYLLRHSTTADQLREQLRGFNATPDEFRAIFRARDAIDNDIQLHYTGNDPNTIRARQELEKSRDNAVEAVLGSERAPLYRATADPLFREAQFLAQQTGAAPEMVLPLYQVQVEGARERARINADTTMTAAQRAAAIRAVADQEEEARRKILGLPAEPATAQPATTQ